MRVFTFVLILFVLGRGGLSAQTPAVSYGETAHGTLGGNYAATRSGNSFFAAQLVETTGRRTLQLKQLGAASVLKTAVIFEDSCSSCRPTSLTPVEIYPTSDGGVLLYYEIETSRPQFQKVNADGTPDWKRSFDNVRFLKAVTSGNETAILYFQLTSGTAATNYIIYHVNSKTGGINWSKNLRDEPLNDFAVTTDLGLVTVSTDSTKMFNNNGVKVWALKRSGLSVKTIDSAEAYQTDATKLTKFRLADGQLLWTRIQLGITDLVVDVDKSALISTNAFTTKVGIAGIAIWQTTIGLQRLQLATNGNTSGVGTGTNANSVYSLDGLTGRLLWQKIFTNNLGGAVRVFPAVENGWFVITRGQIAAKPSSNGTGFVYRLSPSAAPCAFAAKVTPTTRQVICKTGETNLTVGQPGLDLSFGLPTSDYQIEWRRDGVSVASSISYKATTAGRYSAVIRQSGTCSSSSDTVNVELLGKTPPLLTSNLVEVCQGGGASVKLTAKGCSAGSVLWSDTQTGDSVVVSPAISTAYTARCVEKYTIGGAEKTCASDTSAALSIKVLPVSDLTLTGGVIGADSVCRGTSEVLRINVGTKFVGEGTYNWTKNGTLSVGKKPTLSVDESANFQVTATDERGCSVVSPVKKITQIGGRKPTVTANRFEYCLGSNLSSRLTSTGCGTLTTKWSNGQLGDTITVNPNFTTTYQSRCAEMYTSAGSVRKECLGEASEGISVKVLPVSDITVSKFVSPDALCKETERDTLKAELKGFNGSLTSTWFRNGTPVGTGLSLVITETGSYQLKATDTRGCTVETPLKEVLKSNLAVSVFGERQFCEGSATSLKANAIGGIGDYRFQWKLNNVALANSTDSIRFSTPGTYNVTVTDSKGCVANPATTVAWYPKIIGSYAKQVQVKGNLLYNFDPKKITGGNEPLNISISAVTQNNKPIKVDGNTVGNFNENGKVYVKVSDLKGCTFTDSIAITYLPCNVGVSIIGVDVFCYYENVTLTAESKGVAPFTYTWLRESTLTNERSNKFITSTQGIYRTTLTDSANCTATSGPFTISEKGRDINAFIKIASGDSTAYVPFGVDITATEQAGARYEWFRNDSLQTELTVPKITAFRSGKYYVKVSKDGCFNNSNAITVRILIPLAAEKNSYANEVVAFPNPSTEYVIIRASTIKPLAATCRIFDSIGREVFAESDAAISPDHEWRVLTTAWPGGTYFYRVATSEGKVSGKIVKQ